MILEYFGEERPEDFRCGHCDNDAAAPSAKPSIHTSESAPRREAVVDRIVAPPEPDHAPAGFGVGEEVMHGTFGEGLVMSIDGDRAEVDFAGHGTRTIRIEFLRAVG